MIENTLLNFHGNIMVYYHVVSCLKTYDFISNYCLSSFVIIKRAVQKLSVLYHYLNSKNLPGHREFRLDISEYYWKLFLVQESNEGTKSIDSLKKKVESDLTISLNIFDSIHDNCIKNFDLNSSKHFTRTIITKDLDVNFCHLLIDSTKKLMKEILEYLVNLDFENTDDEAINYKKYLNTYLSLCYIY